MDTAKITVSRRDRKKERTRQQIQEVAVRLFTQKGFDNVTIAEISEAADVDVTTFWRHFRSKYVILYADQEGWLEQFRASLMAVPAETGVLQAGIEALMKTPPVGEPALEQLRAQLALTDQSPEVQAAILIFENQVRKEMTSALAARMNVDIETDPRPFIVGETIMAAARWVRLNHVRKNPGKLDLKTINIATIIQNSLDLMSGT